jgi:hypothetical protein
MISAMLWYGFSFLISNYEMAKDGGFKDEAEEKRDK